MFLRVFTDDEGWLDRHLWEHPGHSERVPFWSRVLALRLAERG